MITRKRNLEKQAKKVAQKKLIVFDLDGTLTESKSDIDEEMATILCGLLERRKVAVIGGGAREQFQKQFLAHLRCPETLLENLSILPTSGASFFRFQKNNWRKVYQYYLSRRERTKIYKAFKKAFKEIGYVKPKKTYGKIIEDRQSQITFSALGQKAPLAQKEKWNQKNDVRRRLKKTLEKYLPGFEVRLGGLTSIDITKKDLNKAFGVKEIMKSLSVSKKDVIYIGDALYKGGNDAAVLKTGVDTIQVSGPKEVKQIILKLLSH
jgi:hypothetical protein